MTAEKEKLHPRGRVELVVTKGLPRLVKEKRLPSSVGFPDVYKRCYIDYKNCEIKDRILEENILVGLGKDNIIRSLSSGSINVLARMAIGDRGTIPSDLTVPKVPTPNMTGLFNEVHRSDVDTAALNIGTPGTHELQLIRSFSALDVPLTAFSNQAQPVVNEVGLITADLLAGDPLPRPPVNAPAAADADEQLFSIRTFKSIPFEAANEIAITVRYTIFIE